MRMQCVKLTCEFFRSLSTYLFGFRSFLFVNDLLVFLFLIPLGLLSTLHVLGVSGAYLDLYSVDSLWFPVSILTICQLLRVLDCKCYWLLVFRISMFLLVVVITENHASASDALEFHLLGGAKDVVALANAFECR